MPHDVQSPNVAMFVDWISIILCPFSLVSSSVAHVSSNAVSLGFSELLTGSLQVLRLPYLRGALSVHAACVLMRVGCCVPSEVWQ